MKFFLLKHLIFTDIGKIKYEKKGTKKIISYINDSIKETISTDDSVTNDLIYEGFFSEKEFVEKFIVEIDDDE